jgi:hypothetical protein
LCAETGAHFHGQPLRAAALMVVQIPHSTRRQASRSVPREMCTWWMQETIASRVFHARSAQPGPPAPDPVIGQSDFTTIGANQGGISASTLDFNLSGSPVRRLPRVRSVGKSLVADAAKNRVLRYNASALGAQAVNGPAAHLILGQPDFLTGAYSPNPKTNPWASTGAFETPSGIAFDSKRRLFLMESTTTRRARVLVWTPPFTSGQSATRILGVDVDTPQPPVISGLQFGPATGNLFPFGDGIGVTDTVNSRILIFAPVDQWTPNPLYQAAIGVAGQADFNSGSANQGQPAPSASTLSSPVAAVALDQFLR